MSLIFAAVASAHAPILVNNGDWFRVTQHLGFSIPPWQAFGESGNFDGPINASAPTTLALIAAAFVGLLSSAGWQTFNFELFSLSLFAFFGLTSAFVIQKKYLLQSTVIYCVLQFFLWQFGYFFKSFYEESVILLMLPLIIVGFQRLNACAGKLMFSLAAIAISYAKLQMIMTVPILFFVLLYCAPRLGGRVTGVLALCIVGASLASYIQVKDTTGEANNYNRLYNGLGWSLLNVTEWPATMFEERLGIYANAKSALFLAYQNNIAALPLTHTKLLGTVYWPDGVQLLQLATEHQQDVALLNEYRQIIDQGSLSNYATVLLGHPSALLSLTYSAMHLAVSSDYSLRYLKSPVLHGQQMLSWFDKTLGAWVMVLTLLMCVGVKDWRLRLAFLGFIALPVAVVVGDGFYEFEKHLLTFYLLFPFLLCLYLSTLSRQHVGENGSKMLSHA